LGQSRRSMTVNESSANRYSPNRFPARSSSQIGASQQAIQQSPPAEYQGSGSDEGGSQSAERRGRYADQDSEREHD
jgi:hypothetical protein